MKVTKGKATLFADTGLKGKDTGDELIDGEQRLPLYVTRQKPGFFQKIIGYIHCSDERENGYIRIIGRSVGKIVAILLLLMVLIMAGILVYLRSKEAGPDLDKAAISYEMPENLVNTDPDSIALPGYSVLNVSASDGIVKAPLINPEGNTCYFVYKISLADTEEVLYESGYIEPGSAIPEFQLQNVPEPGSHDILIEVAAWDIEDHTQGLNGGSITAVLEVEE